MKDKFRIFKIKFLCFGRSLKIQNDKYKLKILKNIKILNIENYLRK